MDFAENGRVYITFLKCSTPSNPTIEKILSEISDIVLSFPVTSEKYDAIVISPSKLSEDSKPYFILKGKLSREFFKREENFAFLYIKTKFCNNTLDYLLSNLKNKLKKGKAIIFKEKRACNYLILVRYIFNKEIDDIWKDIYRYDNILKIKKAVTYVVLTTDFIP